MQKAEAKRMELLELIARYEQQDPAVLTVLSQQYQRDQIREVLSEYNKVSDASELDQVYVMYNGPAGMKAFLFRERQVTIEDLKFPELNKGRESWIDVRAEWKTQAN